MNARGPGAFTGGIEHLRPASSLVNWGLKITGIHNHFTSGFELKPHDSALKVKLGANSFRNKQRQTVKSQWAISRLAFLCV